MAPEFHIPKLFFGGALATVVLIAAMWRSLVDARSAWIAYDWLPVAIWAFIPTFASIYSNNMLETTLGMFAAASVYFSLRALAADRWLLAWIAAAALCLLGAVLSQGPTGLFPLATPLLAGLTIQRQQLRKSLAMTAALGATFALLFGLLLLQPKARQYLPSYLHGQIFASLSGHREVVVSRMGHFYILVHILHQMTAPAALAAALVVAANRGGIAKFFAARFSGSDRHIIGPRESTAGLGTVVAFSLLTAPSASLPLTISPKQWGHYAVPSFPYFAIALAGWCAPAVAAIVRDLPSILSRRQRLLRPLAVVSIIFVCVARTDRSQRQIGAYHDMLTLRQIVPRRSVIGIGPEMGADHWLECDLLRWSDVRFEERAATHEYQLTLNGNSAPPDGYAPVAADLQSYRLYRRTDALATTQR